MTLPTSTVLQNRYRIVKLVGQGGFGAVYRGWDLVLEQPVAVKEHFDTGPDSQRQFEREAKLLAGLRHNSLPVVIDHFIVPGQGQYLVMDFIEGKSLRDLLEERRQPLNEAEALPWIRQVCDALTYLHRRTPPIIHRDIKPENVIITNEGRAMLVDFGISKVYDPSKGTTVGAKAVTPGYSPPEQYGRGRTDARSDVYSLGATLYTLLTGQTPPEAPDLSSGADVLVPPRDANPAVSEETSRAILAAMALSMSQRLGDAAGFGEMLPARIAPIGPVPVALPSIAPPATMPLAVPPTLPASTPAPGRTAVRSAGGWRRVPLLSWLLGVVALLALALWAGMALGGLDGGEKADAVATLPATPLSTVGALRTVTGGIQLSSPGGIAVGGNNSIYLVDSLNDHVQKFSADGSLLAQWGSAGSGEGQLSLPWGIVVDSDGNVYVADSNNHRIQKFTANGTFLAHWGSAGSGEGQFSLPWGIAVDSDGNVYVADSNNHRIQKFTRDGVFLRQWGSKGWVEGRFTYPRGIAVDSDGNVYVADANNNRIQKFTADGAFSTQWGTEGSGERQFSYPNGIAVDNVGNVYIVDRNNDRVQKFTAGGRFLAQWGSEGSEEGQFSGPSGIAIDGDGNVYVADAGNHRIQKFNADGEFVTMWGGEE